MVKMEPEFAYTDKPQPEPGKLREVTADLIRSRAELGDSLRQAARQEQRKRRRFYMSLLQVSDALDRILRDTELTELDEIARNRMRSVGATAVMLQGVLAQEDIAVMEDLEGRPFDATCEEAVATKLRPDCPDRTVLEVREKGYRWQEQVLRRARVVVSIQS